MWTHVVPVRLSSVCLSSLTFVRRTQAVQILGHISTALGTLAIHWHSLKISRRSSQGTPPPGELNTRGVAKYSDFGPIDGYNRKRCKLGGKLVLITNRKSYMSFRLVPKSVTLNDLERRNGVIFRFFSANSGIFRAHCVKVHVRYLVSWWVLVRFFT